MTCLCGLLSQMRTPQVFSGKRANLTSWKIHTVDVVANAVGVASKDSAAVSWNPTIQQQVKGKPSPSERRARTVMARGAQIERLPTMKTR